MNRKITTGTYVTLATACLKYYLKTVSTNVLSFVQIRNYKFGICIRFQPQKVDFMLAP